MTTLTNFKEYYKTISNSELLSILENQDEYQPFAIEAAKQEFASRQLTDNEIAEAKKALIAIHVKREKQKEKVKVFEDKVKRTGYSLLDTFNPIQTGIPTTEKSIRLIVILFSGLFLYQVFRDYELLKAYFQDFTRSPLVSTLILFPIIVLPIAILTIWKRQRIGWILLTIYLTFSIVGVLWAFYQSLFWKPSGFELMDNLFPKTSPVTFVVQLSFLAGTLYVLCQKKIRDIFLIRKNEMQAIITITAIVSFFLTLAIS